MEVERTGPAPADQRGGFFVARRDPLAELARQDVAARDRQASRPGPPRHREIEDVFLDPVEIEVPRNDAGPARRVGEGRDIGGRPGDRQVMVKPGRRGVARDGRGGGPPAPPFRGGGGATDGRRRGRGGLAVPGGRGTKASQIEHPGRALGHQAGAADIAAHGAQIAMPRVAHDVLVARALGIGLGDEADPQRVRAQPVEPLTDPSGSARPCGCDAEGSAAPRPGAAPPRRSARAC